MIKLGDSMLVNCNEMLKKAKEGHYAVPHLNINNLEWTKYILEKCNELNIPIILGVSEGAAKYMGGFIAVSSMVNGLIISLKITTPVCLHLDHGSSFESCKEAIDAGFTSVMIDGSKHELAKNIELTKKVVDYAHPRGVSVEAEIGHIGGSEDNVSSNILNATLEDCVALYQNTGIDSLAPALGSVHGFYKGEPNLDFVTMENINRTLPIPLVLHGGTGIPEDMIKKAISCGISKINVNTELQVVWSKALRDFVAVNENIYDPRKIIGSGEKAIKDQINKIVTIFGTRL